MSISRLLLSRPLPLPPPLASNRDIAANRRTADYILDDVRSECDGDTRARAACPKETFSSFFPGMKPPCENECKKKTSAFRGEAVFERREEEKKGERREGRPDGQTCASAWICRNVEKAEAVDVTWGKRLLFIVSHPSPSGH